MSITFSCLEAPRHIVVCDCMHIPADVIGINTWVNQQDFETQREWGCDVCGYMAGMSVSEAPEINWTASNVMRVFDVLGLEFDNCGEWKVEDLHAIHRAIANSMLRYLDKLDEDIYRRLVQLESLVSYAIVNSYSVTWG